jgi:ligand-binding sensor domain-containing protein/signal transduction histidine kinase/DNA-binding response OmpR family regulator
MKSHYILLLIALLFSGSIPGRSNPDKKKYYFRSLDISNGLSQNTVHAILQDKQGFMWFGTKDGLNRYDGLSIQTFMKENGRLGNNFITALHEDSSGIIWIGTDAGIYTYSPLTESIDHFTVKSNRGTIIDRSVTTINSDNNGDTWISVDEQGLFCFHPKTGRLDNLFFRDQQSIIQNITRFLLDTNGQNWVALYADNLYYTLDQFKTLIPFTTVGGDQPFKNDIINKIIKGDHNRLYVGSAKGGLREINLTTRKVRDILITDERGNNVYVREVVFYTDDELWIGTELGVFIYNIQTGSIIHQRSIAGDPYSLNDNAIYSLCKDREGGMWIGSFFGGVNYYPKQHAYFEKIYPHKGLEDMGKRVRELCADSEGALWIGTEDKGLFHYNLETGELIPFNHAAIYHNIHGLNTDGKYLWVGTFSGGLNRIDLKTKAVRSYQKEEKPNTLDANDVFAICHTTTDELWLGTTSGLLRYNYSSDNFTRIPELNGVFIYDIKEDSQGNIWLATYVNGVYKLNIQNRKWEHFIHDPNKESSLSYNKVLSIFEDSHQQLWFTTQGGGFCRFEPSTKTFVRYDFSIGLPSNVVYQIVEDNSGFFWITTNKGLVRFNPQANYIKIYTVADGLLSNQFNYRSGYKDKKGKIYLGSINGLITFDPSTFTDSYFIPPVVITDFSVFNKKVTVGAKGSPLKHSITLSDAIELTAKQNSFSLSVAALSYQAPEMNKLLYTLEGFDQEWYTTGKGSITYNNLPYGTYTFKVKGSNSDGVWNDTIRTLYIHILPPFYLSIGAYIVYAFLIIALISYLFIYFKRRTAQKHQRKMEKFEREKERELYQSKIEFFTNVTHEIRTPLTLIKSPLENLLKEKHVEESTREDLLIMDKNADRLLNLTNQLLDFRKTESDGFKLAFMESDIIDLIQSVFIRFTPLAKRNGLNFTINIECERFQAAVDREALTKIVSNLLTNAVKFADTYVHLLLKREEGEFSIIVNNDGKVVPIEMREAIFQPFVQYKGEKEIVAGTGIGLALSRSLAELHQGKLRMDDFMDCNRFILFIPITHQTVLSIDKESEATGQVGSELIEVASSIKVKKNKPTLLIVDDDQDMISFLHRQLSPLYITLTAVNGLKALEVLEREYIKLVISDIMMPQMDGMELCDRLKSDINYSHIPVILLTAKATMQSKIEGLRLGADAYIEKPFSMELLKANITNLIHSRELLKLAFANSPFTSFNTVALTKADEEFLKKLDGIILANYQNPEFSMDSIAEKMNMSRSSFYRKIKGTIDLSPNDYLRVERLKKASQLLKEGLYQVNEICYMVGFSSPSYFSKCFLKQFGVLPKDFVK